MEKLSSDERAVLENELKHYCLAYCHALWLPGAAVDGAGQLRMEHIRKVDTVLQQMVQAGDRLARHEPTYAEQPETAWVAPVQLTLRKVGREESRYGGYHATGPFREKEAELQAALYRIAVLGMPEQG